VVPLSGVHLFVVGSDYHLGDLLWLTAFLGEYREQVQPERLLFVCPDRPANRILEGNPLIDDLRFGDPSRLRDAIVREVGCALVVRDLRPAPLARLMLREWRHHWPWLYYRDLWARERGQWLTTLFHLAPMRRFRPVLRLDDADRALARTLPTRYVAFAPHIGEYGFRPGAWLWRRIKGWDDAAWVDLAARVRRLGCEPLTLSARGQPPVRGTRALAGCPIRQIAGVVERAAALVTGESGLWFVAAALGTPFVIVPWWLPRGVDWAAPMGVPHRLIRRHEASVERVFACVRELLVPDRP
jgi:hypothetical protein